MPNSLPPIANSIMARPPLEEAHRHAGITLDDFRIDLSDNAVLIGSPGNDWLYTGDGNDRLEGKKGDDLLTSHGGKDILRGGPGNDQLGGGNGDDRLYGGAGKDRLLGEDGNDRLFGGDDDDTLYGGNGRDQLYGGLGTDRLHGGADRDTFAWREEHLGGTDYILDFRIGEDALRIEDLFGSTEPYNRLRLTFDGQNTTLSILDEQGANRQNIVIEGVDLLAGESSEMALRRLIGEGTLQV